MNDVTIRIDGLWKRYGLPVPAVMRKGINWFHAIRNPQSAIRNTDDGPWALRDISLQVKAGETLGIIGRNGAGKSTLLKVLAGVTPPTTGRIEVRGRLFAMIELNAGLHKELTGRENVRLLGAVMGLGRNEIEAKMAEIVDFCELGEWFDRPVRKYSSGMLARLGFAVAVSVDAEILLVDEVLAVGDLGFQRKCYRRFEELRKEGAATLFVSHNMRQVERICDQVLFLDNGHPVEMGSPGRVCLRYYRMSASDGMRSEHRALSEVATWESSGELEIKAVEIMDQEKRSVQLVRTLDSIRIRVHFNAEERIVRPVIGVTVLTSDMIKLLGMGTGHNYQLPVCLEGNGFFELFIPNLSLLPGVYSVGITVKSQDSRKIYSGQNLANFSVEHSIVNKNSFGMVHTDSEWKFSEGSFRTHIGESQRHRVGDPSEKG
ncbi:MAG: ABC transporter ATP-binding protein [Deltaproteobacteria bacterium]|nr:ABC transporter ATP-binding protein [Deltaproteobacteria bacterium]